MKNKYPKRKQLPHDIPLAIDASRQVFFITVCLADRSGKTSLASDSLAIPLIDTVIHRNKNHTWWCSTFMIMPDHIHGLIRFSNSNFAQEQSMRKAMLNWKSWTAKTLGIKWQRDWFDHRLRSDESEYEKSTYIRNNPVRSGLVKNPDDWPYRFVVEE
ncbi:MAG: hypothetical protein GXP30_13480 [Verrucomicrobia bacterium]|nr:hypothetical protein [Verrucomicrobiota bacterium]